MASEISFTGTFIVSPADIQPFEREILVVVDQSSPAKIESQVTILTAATLIPLGPINVPHWAWFKNLDPSNYIDIHDGDILVGHTIARLYPGKECVIPLNPDCVPFATADTGDCLLDYMIAQQ